MRGAGLTMVALLVMASNAWAQATSVATIRPQFLPPGELAHVLGMEERGGRMTLEWRSGGETHSVDVRRHDGANLMILSGTPEDLDAAQAMIKAADVAPHQILIEAQIVEVDRNKLTDLGLDWSQISARLFARSSYSAQFQKRTIEFPGDVKFTDRRKLTDRVSDLSAQADIATTLRFLESSGAATLRDAPRILTLNNRKANILDGQRVTYITRYSSFTNLFETDTLDAGLTLTVTPSLGETGYLTLDVRTELTSLRGEISGSPVKDGQIVENTVVAKDGQTILLGGFQRSSEQKTRRDFPFLGRVIPFLFSSTRTTRSNIESFVALTARVVDMNAGLDDRSRGILEGATPGGNR